ncbi:MAG: hypothetical protein ACE5GL_03365 [Calditrichia bacterium]
MEIEEIISPETLYGNKVSETVRKNPEIIALDWLDDNLWSLMETVDLKEVRNCCITARLPYRFYLDNKPIFFSEKAKRQREDWHKKKAPCPPKNYWKDEQGNLLKFSSGQIIEIQVEFSDFREIADYRLIEEFGYSSWGMTLVED